MLFPLDFVGTVENFEQGSNHCGINIVENPTVQKKQEIVVVPTIVVYKDGVEVKRYQADISFTMKATRKEVQDYITELIMGDF